MILLIDNYDSFTYNLIQAVETLGVSVIVKYNDEHFNIETLNPEKIIISPGPGTPVSTGHCLEIIQSYKEKKPILGVCLGHQCLGAVFGVGVQQSKKILHGKTSLIYHNQTELYRGIPSPFKGARYHSLSLPSIPPNFNKTAWTNDGEIMAIQHKTLPLFGVQFHPESFLTPRGSTVLENFLNV